MDRRSALSEGATPSRQGPWERRSSQGVFRGILPTLPPEPVIVEAPPLERKLVAILAADVAGYSRMMHQDEDATLAILTTHRTIIDDLITAGRGQISGTAGDSVLAEFASVVDAVHCAVAIQQALHKANADLPQERRMRLRIGINGSVALTLGDAICSALAGINSYYILWLDRLMQQSLEVDREDLKQYMDHRGIGLVEDGVIDVARTRRRSPLAHKRPSCPATRRSWIPM